MENIQPKQIPCFKRWNRKGWSVFASLKRYVTIGVLAVGMSMLLLATQGASAQDADTAAVLRTLRIERVGITGSRTAPTRSTLAQTPLFDRKAEAAAPLRTPEAALRLAPSVDLRERGGSGAQADISIRGGSFDQTMVLLNGIDFTDARTGHQSHALPVDLDAVAGIDLIEGVAGVGAYAGAVNIRTAPLAPDYLRFDGSGGSYGYGHAALSGAATHGGFTLMSALSARRSDGYRPNTDFDTRKAYLRATCETERAGLFDLQAGWMRHAFGSNGFYAAYNPDQWERTKTMLGSARWLKRFGRLSIEAATGWRKVFDRYDWKRGEAMNRHRTEDVTARLQVEFARRGGVTSLGGDCAFNRIRSTNLGEELAHPDGRYTHAKRRRTGNLRLRHTRQWERLDLAAALGAAFTPYGRAALWSLSTVWRPTHAWRLEAAVTQSMRLPTFTDLYYTSPAQINHPDLKPERAVTCRLAAARQLRRWQLSATAYYRAGRDIIDWVWREDMEGKWHSEQTSELDTYGIELAGGYSAPTGVLRRLSLAYACTTTDRSSRLIARSALDFLRHKAVLTAGMQLARRCTLTLTGLLCERNGSYTAYPVAGDASVTEIRSFEPYGLVDARLAWEKGVCRLWLDATNLTDTRYCDLGGIPLAGRCFTAGLSVTIGR